MKVEMIGRIRRQPPKPLSLQSGKFNGESTVVLVAMRGRLGRQRPESSRLLSVAVAVVLIGVIASGAGASVSPSHESTARTHAAPSTLPVGFIPAPRPETLPTELAGVDPRGLYSGEPAPMGIADYGVNNTGADYTYMTDSFIGNASIDNLSVSNSSTLSTSATIQLNVVLAFNEGSSSFVYWIQDVTSIDTSNNNVSFIDNIWNFSSPTAEIQNSTLFGNGVVATPGGYYYDYAAAGLPGNSVDLRYPATILLEVNSTTSPSGEPEVTFAYNDGFGWTTYDQVIFKFATSPSTLVDYGFIVDGYAYNPTGYLFYDAELILGGPGGGSSTTDEGSHVQASLCYFNGYNYQTVLSPWNFGSNTAETISNVTDSGEYYTANGTLFGNVSAGSGSLGELWDSSAIAQETIYLPDYGGTLLVGGTPYAVLHGAVTLILAPGGYSLSAVNYSGQVISLGNYSFAEGTTALTLPILEDPLVLLSVSASGPVSGPVAISFTGSWPWSGAEGSLLLVRGLESTTLDQGLSGNYDLNTATFADGNYSVYYQVVAPFGVKNFTSANLYFQNHQVTLKEELAAADAKVTSLQQELNSANGTITTLLGELSSADATIISLQAQLASANATITTLRAEVAAENSTILDLTRQVASLTTELGQNNSTVVHFESVMTNLSVQVTLLESNVTGLRGEIATLQSELAAKSGYVAPAWYDADGGIPVYALAMALLVIGVVVGILLGRRRSGGKDVAGW
ncbi:MAG TPA: thermopsin family protease [Thermoplasmata archaeon]